VSRSKSGRLLLLHRLREADVIDREEQSLQEIGDALGVDRATILRDFRVLDQVEAEYERLMAIQPWRVRELTTSEFAGEIDASEETVRMLIRDGLIQARKFPQSKSGRWYIPVEELERWREWISAKPLESP
jgi:hypothetical protein